MAKAPIIPVPSYLLSDAELKDIAARLVEMDGEATAEGRDSCPRAVSCLAAIKAELTWRGNPFTLNDDGSISNG